MHPYKTHVPGRMSSEDQMSESIGSQGLLSGRSRRLFTKLFRMYSSEKGKSLDMKHVLPLDEKYIIDVNNIEVCPKDVKLQHELLDKLVICKLNGGLGSTMGCTGPKSAIEVRQDMSFLDLTVRQVEYLNSLHGTDVPLVLMNSFNTHEKTVRIIRKYRMHNLSIHTFNQHCYPLIVKESLLPLPTSSFEKSSRELWYPPGHGDIYESLFESGLLENLIKQGKEYIFISNVDNLGATVNLDLMYHMINTESEFMMEITEKTRVDVQGGTLISYRGHPTLLESMQIPTELETKHKNGFCCFNTNNIWVNLRAIQRVVAKEALNPNPVVVHRTLPNGQKVIQLETAAGGVMKHFENFIGVKVPRSRFLPVKSSSDLFLVQSNLYTIKHGTLIMNPLRPIKSIPNVKLGREFKEATHYRKRLLHGIPNILELEHLTVAGDVHFGRNVTLKGTVILVANEGSHIDIPDGSILEDKVITGNLRIHDH